MKKALLLADNDATKCLAYPASLKIDRTESKAFLWLPCVMPSAFSMTNALAKILILDLQVKIS